jgi:hypothetical protein
MADVLPVTTLVDDAVRLLLNGEGLNVGDDSWRIAVESAWFRHDHLCVKLTICGPYLWTLTLAVPPFVDRAWLLAVLAIFLRQPDDRHRVVNAAQVDGRDIFADARPATAVARLSAKRTKRRPAAGQMIDAIDKRPSLRS